MAVVVQMLYHCAKNLFSSVYYMIFFYEQTFLRFFLVWLRSVLVLLSKHAMNIK
jgi:hypothetical protein